MNVLVTGATGFVGRRLVHDLLDKAVKVRILRQGPLPIPERWTSETDIRDGDLTRPASLTGIAEGIHTVFDLAGEIRRPALFNAVNYIGTGNLLEASRKAGVKRFLYMSSVGVIGAMGDPITVDENTTPTPRNLYEKSKYAGERLALSYHDEQGMIVSVLRPSIIYGEGKGPSNDSFYSWLNSIRSGRFFLLGEDYISSYVYVGDVAAAAAMIISSPNTGGHVFNINEPILLRTFVNEIAKLLGVNKVPALPSGIGYLVAKAFKLFGRFGSLYNRTNYSMNNLNLQGFSLPFGYREGLMRTIAWYRPMLFSKKV
jgi:nucleoside-diphosphate-sugar epimerase